MSGFLLDINVLIALTWPTHVHHAPSRQWFDRNSRSGWVTCPITQLGFVRVSSNSRIIRDAVSPREAITLLARLTDLPGHRFWPDEFALSSTGAFASLALVGHRQVTDAYLLTLAQRRDAKLATLDRGIADLIADPRQRARWIETIE
ncbi:type II toxin-antitoxin system VapC family toxin [soil metagenome]